MIYARIAQKTNFLSLAFENVSSFIHTVYVADIERNAAYIDSEAIEAPAIGLVNIIKVMKDKI